MSLIIFIQINELDTYNLNSSNSYFSKIHEACDVHVILNTATGIKTNPSTVFIGVENKRLFLPVNGCMYLM